MCRWRDRKVRWVLERWLHHNGSGECSVSQSVGGGGEGMIVCCHSRRRRLEGWRGGGSVERSWVRVLLLLQFWSGRTNWVGVLGMDAPLGFVIGSMEGGV